MRVRKLKAGALQMVTFIIVVIALLLSSFLILTHVHKQFRLQTNHVVELTRLVDRGIKHNFHELDKSGDTLNIPLLDEDYKSLKVHNGFWGVYEKVYAEAQIKNQKLGKVALLGQETKQSKTALYLKDNRKPLVVVGTSKIKGHAYLPERGVKTGNISGQSYYGTHTIYGDIKESKQFPQLSDQLREHIWGLTEGKLINRDDVQFLDLNTNKKIVNSFQKQLLLVYSNTEILLSNIELSGHVIVQSDRKIVVDQSAHLTDIILIAPEIEIRKHVKGSFQAFATKHIIVSENVALNYPSALVLYGDYEKEQDHFLKIESNSQIKGSIICLGKTQKDNYEVQLKIEKNVLVEGEVYCEQNLELRGSVYGSVYTNNFLVKENGTTYQNHLYNGEIDVSKLTKEYVGLTLNESPKQIMKWLY